MGMRGARRFAGCPLVRLELPSGAACPLYVADGFASRLLGLTALTEWPAQAGLLIPRCRSVHTLGMRFAVDVVWVSWPPSGARRVEVLRVCDALAPSRFARLAGTERSRRRLQVAAVELGGGEAGRLGIREGSEAIATPRPLGRGTA